MGVGAAAVILFGILIFAGGFKAGGIFFLIVGALMGLYCHHAAERAQIRTYSLVLMTSSSEAQAFTSPNRDEVDNLRAKIEQAMAGRLLAD